MRYWTTSEQRRLTELWPNTVTTEVARLMGRSENSVWSNAKKLGLVKEAKSKRGEPPAQVWIDAASKCAREAGLHPNIILNGASTHKASRARWQAWKLVMDSNPRYSAAGLARVSGYNHATILRALKILEDESQPTILARAA